MKEVIVLGDTELGGGTYTDDFISDIQLSKLINGLSKKAYEIDLVLNGDTFDFLKCPYIVNGEHTYPRHIDEEISLSKLNYIYNAHKDVFISLNNFLKNTKHKIYFIIGNHDADLAFPGVQKKINTILGSKNIEFTFLYEKHEIYVEHGHLKERLHTMDPKKLFDNYKGKTLLHMPWISYCSMNALKIKEQHPFSERVFPRSTLFFHYKNLNDKIMKKFISYFLLSAVYYRFRYFFDPTYRFARELLFEPLNQLRDKADQWDIPHLFDLFLDFNKKSNILIFGHAHKTIIQRRNNRVYIHPGSWRDEYDFDASTKTLHPRNKYYVKILINGKHKEWSLESPKIKRTPVDFYLMVADEYKCIRDAAKEEGFKLSELIK